MNVIIEPLFLREEFQMSALRLAYEQKIREYYPTDESLQQAHADWSKHTWYTEDPYYKAISEAKRAVVKQLTPSEANMIKSIRYDFSK